MDWMGMLLSEKRASCAVLIPPMPGRARKWSVESVHKEQSRVSAQRESISNQEGQEEA